MDGCHAPWMDAMPHGWIDGWMDEYYAMDGWMDGWIDAMDAMDAMPWIDG